MKVRQNALTGLSLSVCTVIFALGSTVPAFAQDNAPAANVSPALVSLFLLLVGLVGIGIISARTIDFSRVVPPAGSPLGPVDDDGLVPDDEQQ